MTVIFIENVQGSGQVVKIIEDFGDYSVYRDLRPGENARVAVSPFKSVVVQEEGARGSNRPHSAMFSVAPPATERRYG